MSVPHASNLPYRRLPVGRSSEARARRFHSTLLRLEAVRYSRLEVCATKAAPGYVIELTIPCGSKSNLRQLKTLPTRPGQKRIRFGITHKLFFLRVPLQFALYGAADIHQVAKRGRPVSGLRVGSGG